MSDLTLLISSNFILDYTKEMISTNILGYTNRSKVNYRYV